MHAALTPFCALVVARWVRARKRKGSDLEAPVRLA